MRRAGILCGVALAVGCLAPAASAQQLITWTDSSRFVDPAQVPFNSPPPGVGPRPNALRVNVLLPDGYDGERRFPVLYLLHGHGDSYDAWVNPKRGDLLNVARGFPGIIVMPEAATGWYTNWFNGGARAPGWERYYLDELVPEVESRLRIAPGRANRAIAGLSMGGEGAMFLASQRPGYWGAAASFSGVLSIQRAEWPAGFDTQGERHTDVFGDPSQQEFYWHGHNPTALVDNLRDTRLYVTVGDGTMTMPDELQNVNGAIAEFELHQHAEDFVAAATRVGASTTYVPKQGIHDWPYWRAGLAAAIAWGFFSPVAEAPSRWSYQTVAQHSQAWDLTFDFDTPPTALASFQRDGDTLSASGTGDVHVHQDGGADFRATLPFRHRVARAAAASASPTVAPVRRGSGCSGRRQRQAHGRHRRPRRCSHRSGQRRGRVAHGLG